MLEHHTVAESPIECRLSLGVEECIRLGWEIMIGRTSYEGPPEFLSRFRVENNTNYDIRSMISAKLAIRTLRRWNIMFPRSRAHMLIW